MLSICKLALLSVSETFLKLMTKNNTVDVYYLNYLGHSLSGLESVLFRSILRVAVFLRDASIEASPWLPGPVRSLRGPVGCIR